MVVNFRKHSLVAHGCRPQSASAGGLQGRLLRRLPGAFRVRGASRRPFFAVPPSAGPPKGRRFRHCRPFALISLLHVQMLDYMAGKPWDLRTFRSAVSKCEVSRPLPYTSSPALGSNPYTHGVVSQESLGQDAETIVTEGPCNGLVLQLVQSIQQDGTRLCRVQQRPPTISQPLFATPPPSGISNACPPTCRATADSGAHDRIRREIGGKRQACMSGFRAPEGWLMGTWCVRFMRCPQRLQPGIRILQVSIFLVLLPLALGAAFELTR